ASRCLDNPTSDGAEMVSGPTHAPQERIGAQEVVLLVPDTPFLPEGTTPPTAGLGTVKLNTRAESRLQLPVALTPERVHVGVVGRKVWQRPEAPVAPQCPSK